MQAEVKMPVLKRVKDKLAGIEEPKTKRKMKPGGGIYLITCLSNNKIYVGSAKCLESRFIEHTKLLNISKHYNRHLQNAWSLYGSEAFKFSIHKTLEAYDKKNYFAEENTTIDFLKKQGKILFNIARAEGGWGEETFKRRDEICAKISASLLLKNSKMTEDERKIKFARWQNGTTSEKHRKAVAVGMMGLIRTPENCANISKGLRGHLGLIEAGKKTGFKNLAKKGDVARNAKSIIVNGRKFSSLFLASESGLVTPKLIAHLQNPIKHPLPARFKKNGIPNVIFA